MAFAFRLSKYWCFNNTVCCDINLIRFQVNGVIQDMLGNFLLQFCFCFFVIISLVLTKLFFEYVLVLHI